MQRFLKTPKPCHVGIHWKALGENLCARDSDIFQFFSTIFYWQKLASSSKRVKDMTGLHISNLNQLSISALSSRSEVQDTTDLVGIRISYLTSAL